MVQTDENRVNAVQNGVEVERFAAQDADRAWAEHSVELLQLLVIQPPEHGPGVVVGPDRALAPLDDGGLQVLHKGGWGHHPPPPKVSPRQSPK